LLALGLINWVFSNLALVMVQYGTLTVKKHANTCTPAHTVTKANIQTSHSITFVAKNTFARADPRPSSSMLLHSTPTMVLLPESTLPIMATRTCAKRNRNRRIVAQKRGEEGYMLYA